MYPPVEVFKATERELVIRREGLIDAARGLLEREPYIIAVIYIGSVLYKSREEEMHFDTDFILLTEPQFVHTPDEVNIIMSECLAVASEKHRVDLPYPDTYDVVKVRHKSESVTLGPFQRDYGNLVVGRAVTYFDPPANRTQVNIITY